MQPLHALTLACTTQAVIDLIPLLKPGGIVIITLKCRGFGRDRSMVFSKVTKFFEVELQFYAIVVELSSLMNRRLETRTEHFFTLPTPCYLTSFKAFIHHQINFKSTPSMQDSLEGTRCLWLLANTKAEATFVGRKLLV